MATSPSTKRTQKTPPKSATPILDQNETDLAEFKRQFRNDQIDELSKKLDSTISELRGLEKQLAVQEATYESFKSSSETLHRFQDQITDLGSAAQSATAQRAIHGTQISTAEGSLDDLRTRQAALESELNQTLKSTEKRIDDGFERQWKLPKILISVFSLIAVLGIIGGIVKDYYTYQDVREAAKKLDLQSIDKIVADTVSEQINPKLKETEGVLVKAQEVAGRVQGLLSNQNSVANLVNAALSNTSLGHQQLAYERNPHQALVYANLALKNLDDPILKNADSTEQILAPVRANVLILMAQALMEIGDHESAMIVANELITIRPEGSEGYHFRGLGSLLKAADEPRDEPRRNITEIAIKSFKQALTFSEHRGNPDLLYLAMAEFDNLHFQASLDLAAEFVGDNDSVGVNTRHRLGANIQGKIAIASAWITIARYKLGRDIGENMPNLPTFAIGAIRPEEGRILESMLTLIVRRNPDCEVDPNCQAVRKYCEGLLKEIRTCCYAEPKPFDLPAPPRAGDGPKPTENGAK